MTHPLNLWNLDLVSSETASLRENSLILLLTWKSPFFTFPWFWPKFGDFFQFLRLILKIWEMLDRKTWRTHPLNLGNLNLGSSEMGGCIFFYQSFILYKKKQIKAPPDKRTKFSFIFEEKAFIFSAWKNMYFILSAVYIQL